MTTSETPSSIPTLPDQEHWSVLHQPEHGGVQQLIERAKQRVLNASFPEIAGAAVTGFALGWLIFSQRRSHTVREVLFGTIAPAAAKRVHDVWDNVRSSDALHALGDQAAKLKARW